MQIRHAFAIVALLALASALAACSSLAKDPSAAAEAPIPKLYECRAAAGPIVIDGRIDDPGWRDAVWTDLFIDIQGEHMTRPRFPTRAKMAWDDACFYVAAWLDEPHVWGTLTERDSIIYNDNDFEVFIDPDGDRLEYYEIEVNALNTVFDLRLVKPYSEGGPAILAWDLPGLETAVHVEGTLNDPSDMDDCWSVELALPWSSLAEYAGRPSPPEPGDVWRVNFSRVQWRHAIAGGRYVKIPREISPEDNWVWSPQGVINMHVPEHWGHVRFVRN